MLLFPSDLLSWSACTSCPSPLLTSTSSSRKGMNIGCIWPVQKGKYVQSGTIKQSDHKNNPSVVRLIVVSGKCVELLARHPLPEVGEGICFGSRCSLPAVGMTLEVFLTVQSPVRCHQCGSSWSDYECELQLVLAKFLPPEKKVEDA